MADRTYTYTFVTNLAQVTAEVNAFNAACVLAGASLDTFRSKTAGLAAGASRTINTTTAAANQLAAALNQTAAAATAAGTAVQGVGGHLKVTSGNAQSAGQSMQTFVGAAVALAAARQAFAMVLDESKRLEAMWQNLAREAAEFRSELRELASMQGEKGPGNAVVGSVLDAALAGRMNANQAKAFGEGYQNLGQTVREKEHFKPDQGTPEDLEKAIVAEAAATAHRLGIDPKLAGSAIGSAGISSVFTSVPQAMTEFGGAIEGLQKGTTDYKTGLAALNIAQAQLVNPEQAEAEGATKGRVGSYGEAGIYLGALSVGTGGSADKAGTQMVQISRLLHPSTSSAKGKKAAESLKAAGITDDMDDPARLIQLAEHLKEQGVSDPLAWMDEHGLGIGTGGDASRRAAAAGMKQAGILKDRLAEFRAGRKGGAGGQRTIDANRKFMASDQSSMQMGVDSATDVLDKAIAAEGPELFEKAKQAAEQRMRAGKTNDTTSAGRGIFNKIISPLTYLTSGVGGQGYEQEQSHILGAIPTLRRQAAAVGIDIDKQFPDINAGDYQTRARAFAKASGAVSEKGGDPLGLEGLKAGAQRKVDALRGGPQAKAGPKAAEFETGEQVKNGQLEDINRKQLDVLTRIERKLPGGDIAAGRRAGPLPVDGGDAGPLRS